MNQQQFSDSPENSSNAQPVINPDPREWGSGQEGLYQDYQAGHTAASQRDGGKIYPTSRPRRRGRFRWLWIIVAFLLICFILGLLGGFTDGYRRSAALTTHTFAIQNEPKLVVTNAAGTVTIHTGGSGNNIVVAGTKHAGFFGNLNDVQVNLTRNGNNELDVTVQDNQGLSSFLNADSVDLNITVPSLADIQDTSDAGTMNIDGVTGQMNLRANAGTINVQDATLKGPSTFAANAGSINYSGSLATDGTYNFQANAGSINLTLPSNSAFNLDASVNVGSVNNDFGSNTVGNSPFAQIIAHADAGSVNIHKR